MRGPIAIVSFVTPEDPSAAAGSGPISSMRPTRDPGSPLLLLLLAGLAACGKAALEPHEDPSARPAPMEVVVADPAAPAPAPVAPRAQVESRVETAASAPRAEIEAEAEPDTLPKTWTGPIVPGLTFADAMKKARGARDAFAHLSPPPSTAKDANVKTWFGQAQVLVDQASRMYAAAFHAPDAAREGRIDAISEAADLDMSMARRLDELGLAALPPAWRSDPAVASTFEDIAVGPTRRWRDEARVLARQCIETSRETGVQTEAARRCAVLRTGVPVKIAKRGPDAGAPCACAEGDPLCSASLGGWCGAAAR